MDTSSGLPDVFRWLPGWLEPAEAGRLLELLLVEIPWEDHAVTIVGREVPVPRRVAFYGPYPYTYWGSSIRRVRFRRSWRSSGAGSNRCPGTPSTPC